jgi:hypothetical protein
MPWKADCVSPEKLASLGFWYVVYGCSLTVLDRASMSVTYGFKYSGRSPLVVCVVVSPPFDNARS